MDELQQLFALMGVVSFPEAVAALTTVNSTLDGAQADLGTRGTSATLSALATRSKRLASLEKAAGKEGDEADGLLRAALVSHTELPKVQAEVAKLRQDGQVNELDRAIATAKAASKLTKASEDGLRKAFADGDITLRGALVQLENMPVIPALAASKDGKQSAPPAPSASGDVGFNDDGVPTFKGKLYAELSGVERAELHAIDKSHYAAMRDSAR